MASLVQWSKEKLLKHLLGRLNEKLLDFFVNLPGSFRIRGFMDKVQLDGVCLNTVFVSQEFARFRIPLILKYGFIKGMSIDLLGGGSGSLSVSLDGLTIVVGPISSFPSVSLLIEGNLKRIRRHTETILRTYLSTCTPADQPGENGQGADDSEEGELTKIAQGEDEENSLLAWFFRYDPNLKISVRNLHIRYEDETGITGNHCGFLWDSLEIQPSEAFWRFSWPTVRNSTSETGCGLTLTSSVPVKEPFSNASGAGIRLRSLVHYITFPLSESDTKRSIFLGGLRGAGFYLCEGGSSWISQALEVASKNEEKMIYQLLSIEKIKNFIEKEATHRKWLINPFDATFQFGLESALDGSYGGKLYFDVPGGVRVTMDPGTIATAIKFKHYVEVLYPRWNDLRRTKSLILYKNDKSVERDRRTIAQERWRYSRRYIHRLRAETQRRSPDELNQRIQMRRFRRWLLGKILEFHLSSLLDEKDANRSFLPDIAAPLSLLHGRAANKKLPAWRYDQSTRQLSLEQFKQFENTRCGENRFCRKADFEDTPIPPLAYFFLLNYNQLQQELLNNPADAELVTRVLVCRNPDAVSQWVVLTFREAEEILRRFVVQARRDPETFFDKRNLPQYLRHIPVVFQSGASIFREDAPSISAWFQRSATIPRTLHWNDKINLRIGIQADFYSFYASSFPQVLCENVDRVYLAAFFKSEKLAIGFVLQLTALFAFKAFPSHMPMLRMSDRVNDTSFLPSHFLDCARAQRAVPITPSIACETGHQLKQADAHPFTVEDARCVVNDPAETQPARSYAASQEVPLASLIHDQDPLDSLVLKRLIGDGYAFPSFLWRISCGLLCPQLEIRVVGSDDAAGSRQEVISVVLKNLGVEFRLVQQLEITAVLQCCDFYAYTCDGGDGENFNLQNHTSRNPKARRTSFALPNLPVKPFATMASARFAQSHACNVDSWRSTIGTNQSCEGSRNCGSCRNQTSGRPGDTLCRDWNVMKLLLITKSMTAHNYKLELPLFLDGELHLNDITASLSLAAIDRIRRLLLAVYASRVQTANHLNNQESLDWTGVTSGLSHRARVATSSTYTSTFYAKVVPIYFPQDIPSKALVFWRQRLLPPQSSPLINSVIARMKQAVMHRTSMGNSWMKKTHGAEKTLEVENHPAIANTAAMAPSTVMEHPFRTNIASSIAFSSGECAHNCTDATFLKNTLRSAVPHPKALDVDFSPQINKAIEKTRISISFRFPAVKANVRGVQPRSEEEVVTDILTLDTPPHSILVVTGKRADGSYVFLRSTFLSAVTKQTLRHCIKLFKTVDRVVRQRIWELRRFLARLQSDSQAVNASRRSILEPKSEEAEMRVAETLRRYRLAMTVRKDPGKIPAQRWKLEQDASRSRAVSSPSCGLPDASVRLMRGLSPGTRTTKMMGRHVVSPTLTVKFTEDNKVPEGGSLSPETKGFSLSSRIVRKTTLDAMQNPNVKDIARTESEQTQDNVSLWPTQDNASFSALFRKTRGPTVQLTKTWLARSSEE